MQPIKSWRILKNEKFFESFTGTFDQAWDYCEKLSKASTAGHDYSFE